MKLSELKTGNKATVTKINCVGKEKRLLDDAGVSVGVRVRAVIKAPMGDLVLYDFSGVRIALRDTFSEKIIVNAVAE